MSHPSFPRKVFIWKEGTLACVDVAALASYLRTKLKGIEVVGPYEIWEGVAEVEVAPERFALASGEEVACLQLAHDSSCCCGLDARG